MTQRFAFPRPQEPTVDDLPAYLGFGLLDQGSMRSENGALSAAYSAAGGAVHEVRWAPNDCLLKSWWRGREIGQSRGSDLEAAFFANWWSYESLWLDRPKCDLFNQITGMGNVYIPLPGREYAFYPAGLMFTLRLPILATRLPAWETFKRRIRPPASPLVLHREGPGVVLRLGEEGEFHKDPVLVVDLHVPLAWLAPAVVACLESGIVSDGKHYRLEASASAGPGGCAWQRSRPYPSPRALGAGTRGEQAFAVLHADEIVLALAAPPDPMSLRITTPIVAPSSVWAGAEKYMPSPNRVPESASGVTFGPFRQLALGGPRAGTPRPAETQLLGSPPNRAHVRQAAICALLVAGVLAGGLWGLRGSSAQPRAQANVQAAAVASGSLSSPWRLPPADVVLPRLAVAPPSGSALPHAISDAAFDEE